jgi:hypothetical protein
MTVVVVHDPITVDGVDYGRGDRLFGDAADAVLANPIWARAVVRAPEDMHDIPDDAVTAAPAPQIAAPPPAPSVPAAAAATVPVTLTDTTKTS